MITYVRHWADRLISLSAAIGSLGLLAETLILIIDVIGRAVEMPLFGSQDLITMTMVILVFGGMAICDRRGGHISVDLLERAFPARLNRVIDALSALIGCLIFLAIAYTVYDSSRISVMLNLSTNLLQLPKAWFQYALACLAMLTAFAMLLRAVELLFTHFDVREHPNG